MKDFIIQYNSKNRGQWNNPIKEVFQKIYKSDDRFIECSCSQWNFAGITEKGDLSKEQLLGNIESGKFSFYIGDVVSSENLKKTATDIIDEFKGNSIEYSKLVSDFEGDYIILSYDQDTNILRVASSKLGLIPCYYYISNNTIIISSRLLLLRTLITSLKVDNGTLAQFCLYNYIISDKTIYKDINSIPAATIAEFSTASFSSSDNQYWNPTMEMADKSLGFKDSTSLINEALDTIISGIIIPGDKVGISVTGGWDGRLLLSYVRNYLEKEDTLLYSFGTLDSPDVYLPKKAAQNLSYNYIPINLRSETYSNEKLNWAKQTMFLSDGLRSYRRAHYLYAMDLLHNKIDYIITGLGGSNLIKSGAINESNVLNKFTLELLYSDNYEEVIHKHYNYIINKYSAIFTDLSEEEFYESFQTSGFKRLFFNREIRKRIITFLLLEVERKYFGGELLSYRHLLKNYTPFFDIRFIRALVKTRFFGGYEVSRTSIEPLFNTMLYSKLVCKNYPELGRQRTDRGFSFHNIRYPLNPMIGIRYLKIKREHRRSSLDYYSTGDLFEKIINSDKNLSLKAVRDYHEDSFISNYITQLSFIRN